MTYCKGRTSETYWWDNKSDKAAILGKRKKMVAKLYFIPSKFRWRFFFFSLLPQSTVKKIFQSTSPSDYQRVWNIKLCFCLLQLDVFNFPVRITANIAMDWEKRSCLHCIYLFVLSWVYKEDGKNGNGWLA